MIKTMSCNRVFLHWFGWMQSLITPLKFSEIVTSIKLIVSKDKNGTLNTKIGPKVDISIQEKRKKTRRI